MSPLPPGWVTCTLDDIKGPGPHAITGGPFGSDLGRADYLDPGLPGVPGAPAIPGVPVIRGANLGAGERRFYTDDLVFISHPKADALAATPPAPATSSSPSAAPSIRSASSPTTPPGRASSSRRAR